MKDVELKETFLPDLPPLCNIESLNIMRYAILATRELERLNSKALLLPNQDILISSIALSEAKDSSEIENIITTNDLLYKMDIASENDLDSSAKEVRDYNKALWLGIELIKKRPLAQNIFIKIVQAIKHNTAEIRKTKGTVIKNVKTGEVIHVPPQGEKDITDKLSNLEYFLYDNKFKDIDPLIKMAVMHYQFESIHPFLDGNGRTGRIINILWLVQEGLLNKPILFLSRYYLKHKNEYYKKLQLVTKKQDWEGWIIFILKSVIETSKNTSLLIDKILNARNYYKNELKSNFKKIYSAELLDVIFSSPYFRIENLQKKMPELSRQTASKYLSILSKEYDNGKKLINMEKIGRQNIYFNKILFDILTSN